jgi:Ca-activated chloride channel family protein
MALPAPGRPTEEGTMKSKAAGRNIHDAITDLVELIAKAVLSGIGAGVAMGLAILALSANAQAASINDARTGTLLLRAAGGLQPAPTVATEVAIEVTGVIARTRVTQVFHNPGAEHVEGIYVFPLPEKAAVDRLWMRIGERVVVGQVREKEEARRAYEAARAEGRKAALVEQQRPNLFTNSVAHIGPGDRIEIKIEYQQALGYDNGEYRLRFPLAVTPRYVPMGAPPADAMPDEPKALEAREPLLNPLQKRRAQGLVNPVDIAVVIDAGAPIGHVQGSYHDMLTEKEAGGRTVVFLAREQEEADRDFELTWRIAQGNAPIAAMFTHRGSQHDYALVMVTPPQPSAADKAEVKRLPREVLLVIDTSGSMEGASIQQARLALENALGTLTPRDRFNVIEFNSDAYALFPDTLPATRDNVQHALTWVRGLKARGGTNMMSALAMALNGRDMPGYLRQVVFMTDGAVGNEDQLFRYIAERLGGSRLFTVGIGSAPNGHFMARAAQFGRGTFTYIGDLNEVNEKMSRLFEKIEAPVLRDVSLRFAGGGAVETFPARVPDLYLGEPVLVAVAAKAPLGTVVVTGTLGNQPWSVALTPEAQRGSNGVGALWARFKIASLMDELTRGAPVESVRPEVVKVALEHHLVSAYTSLVAVDLTPTAPAKEPRAAMVATAAAQGSVHLPQTATPAALQLLVGVLSLLLAALVGAMRRKRASA